MRYVSHITPLVYEKTITTIAITTTFHTRQKLTEVLKNLGVEVGDVLFIHSSVKSLGPVGGGARTVVGALEDAVGPKGLILIPSFNLMDSRAKRAAAWNVQTTPSTVGWLTEFFRQMPGTYRSEHYSNSVAARGNGAKEFVKGHLSRRVCKSPWEHERWRNTYGSQSPMYKAYKVDGKLLMLGVDYDTSTYIHLVEAILWNKRLIENPEAKYPGLKRVALGEFWDQMDNLSRNLIGNADCRLFSIRSYVNALVREVEDNPQQYLN